MARTRGRSVAKSIRSARKRVRAKPAATVAKRAKRAGTAPPARDFAKGKFHVSHEATAAWTAGLRGYFAYRDLGMVERHEKVRVRASASATGSPSSSAEGG